MLIIRAMSRKATLWIVGISLCIVGGLVWTGAIFYSGVRAFLAESTIHGTFYPLADALYHYQNEQGQPAKSLGAVVPRYLGTLPTSPYADAPRYRVLPGGTVWELAIDSQVLPQRRLYLCRSTQTYTPEEQRRMILYYHATWAVFPATP